MPLTVPHSSSGGGTIGQRVADVPSGLSLTPPQELKKKTANRMSRFSYELHQVYGLIFILPLLCTHLLPVPEVCNSPGQAAQYHIFALNVVGLSLTSHLASYRTKEVFLELIMTAAVKIPNSLFT
jgi:hypothetical protein